MIFVTRAQWGHPDPDRPGGYYLGVQRQPYLVEHHTPGQDPGTFDEAVAEVRQIYTTHTVGNDWQDIGYNFLIYDRWCFEGRGFGWTGAHAPGANSISLGVAFILDGRYRAPTPVEEQTFRDLAAAAKTYGYLSLNETLTGHRDWVATTCPGDVAYAQLGAFYDTPPEPSTSTGDDVYDFEQRPGGVFQWHVGDVDYGPLGGCVAYDYPDVTVGDLIVIAPTTPDVGPVVVNVFYPSAKQTVPREVRWGQPARISAEEAGFVTVLVSANGANRARVIGRTGA
jgi:hypothetical protein